ncbi:phage protein Gp27 family protein [Pseudacidovorax intermedius]|uniref:phage protein Gp27 family protein n=1 Tax=Pseudacidovorax intermedius TaxID=433924 RepID=UPI0026F35E11|nr:phage protein Gp27 family protein [Pseudacidovorax intermedius]
MATMKRKPSQPSSVTKLPPEIKEAVDAAIREGRATIADIVAMVRQMGGEVSESAAGRYVKNARERLEDYRQAQQVAAVWCDKIGKEPQGNVGRMILEMLRVIAYKSMGDLETVSPEDLMFLSKAMKDLAGADKTMVDREINLLKLMAVKAQEVAASVEKTAKKAGLSDDTINTIKSQILGIPEVKRA